MIMQKMYVLVSEPGRENFQLAVNSQIAKGFVPHGSMSMSTFNGKTMFYQPMVHVNIAQVAFNCASNG